MPHMPLNRPRPRHHGPHIVIVRCLATGKVCFSKVAAEIALATMLDRHVEGDPFRVLHVYPCDQPGLQGEHYHVGHRPARLNRQVPTP